MSEQQKEFIKMMEHAIEMSHHKYGSAKKAYPELAQAHKCVEERIDLYEYGKPAKDIAPHNKDYLIDVANFAMLEAMFPAIPGVVHAPADAETGWKSAFSTAFVERTFEMGDAFTASRAATDRSKPEQIYWCLSKYRNTGMEIMLKNIAWLAMAEFFNPTYEDAFFDRNVAGDKLSPGLAGGISYKELMEGENDGMSRPFDF